MIIMPESMRKCAKQLNFVDENLILCDVDEEISLLGISIKTVPAYNLNKKYHLKEKHWLGYVVNFGKIKIYISGDTDRLMENESIQCDIAMIPIDGAYTMDVKEAANFVNKISPQIVVPTHYGINNELGIISTFKKYVNANIDIKVFLK